MLSRLEDAHIKELSSVHDPQSRETFISLYFGTERPDEHFIEKRKSAVRAALRHNRALLDNFEKVMEKAQAHIEKRDIEKGQKGLVLFASEMNGFYSMLRLPVPVENLLVVDMSPYIKPLASLLDEYRSFGIILLDSHRAKLYAVSSGMVEDEDELSQDIMNKHKKGGWSQARFQRLRQGAVEHFLKEVAEDARQMFEKDGIKSIVLAGPGEAKLHLREYLSTELKSEVIGLFDVDFDESGSCVALRAGELVKNAEHDEVEKNVAHLREEILKNGLAVYGIKETMDAARNGKLALLLVCKKISVRGWKCEKCQLFDIGINLKCAQCGSETGEVDVIEEIVEQAERTDTRIEFVQESPVLEELGGIGGLLRFR